MGRLTGRDEKGNLLLMGDEVYAGKFYNAIEELEKYEDAEEQGRLYISPLKIGDIVFLTPDYPAYWDDIEEAKVAGVALFPPGDNWQISTNACLCYQSENIGKKGIYLTREEAEKSLNGGDSQWRSKNLSR